jgi:hypothetical protein
MTLRSQRKLYIKVSNIVKTKMRIIKPSMLKAYFVARKTDIMYRFIVLFSLLLPILELLPLTIVMRYWFLAFGMKVLPS